MFSHLGFNLQAYFPILLVEFEDEESVLKKVLATHKFLLVQTFAIMPPEAPEEIFTDLIFVPLRRVVQTELLKLSRFLFLW